MIFNADKNVGAHESLDNAVQSPRGRTGIRAAVISK
jgi:hypothetical protein